MLLGIQIIKITKVNITIHKSPTLPMPVAPLQFVTLLSTVISVFNMIFKR